MAKTARSLYMSFCVFSLEKMVHDAQQDEAESCRALQAEGLDIKRHNEEKIQMLVGENMQS